MTNKRKTDLLFRVRSEEEKLFTFLEKIRLSRN